MDTLTLVDKQITDAESWLAQLKREEFPVRAAFWAKRIDEERWSLYFATPAREKLGTLDVYSHVLKALRELGEVSFRGSDVVKLVSDKHPIAKGVLDFVKRFPDMTRTRLSQSVFGDQHFEGAYIYSLGEVRIPIYGLVFRGEPSGTLNLSFEKFKSPSWVEIGLAGESVKYPAETGIDWIVATPEGSKLEHDEYGRLELTWNFRGIQKQSNANEVMALADLGLHGFRKLSEPANLKTAVIK